MIYSLFYPSPLGTLFIAEQDGYIIGLWMEGQNHYQREYVERGIVRETCRLGETKEWLDMYFQGENPYAGSLGLSLCLCHGKFQKEVLEIVRHIPYGSTLTYGEVARKLSGENGRSGAAAQAVGRALSCNPLSILVPCHRVIGRKGHLTGYAGGIERKAWLLKHEGVL